MISCFKRSCTDLGRRLQGLASSSGLIAKVQRVKKEHAENGVLSVFGKVLTKLMRYLVILSMLPWLFRCSFRMAGFRIVVVNFGRIGHLAAELDGVVKENILYPRWPRIKPVILCLQTPVFLNSSLFSFYSKYYWNVKSRLICNLLTNWGRNNRLLPCCDAPDSLKFDTYAYLCPIDTAAKYPRVLAEYGCRPPVVSFSEEDRARGTALMRELGIPRDAWFVCIHARQAGYSEADDHIHSFRNASIENYLHAMSCIVDRGGVCVRMGDPSTTRLPALNGVIDYAHHPLRSDWLDIYLTGNCRFFLGCASGLAQVATAFGIPCAIANQAPFGVLFNVGIRDISIPKLYWCKKRDRLITFAEILRSPMSNFRYSSMFEKEHISLQENTPDEIASLAMEMMDQVDGRIQYSEEDNRSQRYLRSKFHACHYSYFGAGRVGREFLRKHGNLMS